MAPARQGQFVNAIPNDARYRKSNGASLDQVCESAFQGDLQALETLLSSGDEDNIFNGDLNLHYTDVNALHMAAMAGHEDCVKLLLEARADPHVRVVVADGKDPKSGETARQRAEQLGHKAVAELLQQAESEQPPGWYVEGGIGNNHKLYSEPKPASRPAAPASPPTATPSPAAAPASSPAAAPVAEPADSLPMTLPSGGDATLPVALLFPGQGSQYVRMLSDVKDSPAVKAMLTKANAVLGYDLLELCLKGPEDRLEQTRYCQPAMFVSGLAGIVKLCGQREEAVTRARCVAGLSLGEYTALCAAGVLSFETGLQLVKLRGEAMQEAAQVGKQGMISVVGLEEEQITALCAKAAAETGGVCKIANALFPKGYSCAGTDKAVQKLKTLSEGAGALQAKVLKTSGAFHTELMAPAQERLTAALAAAQPSMKPPRCTVYMNVTGEAVPAGTDPSVIVDLLSKQLVNTVLWSGLVQKMMADGIDEFFECGPQKQIKAMMRRIDQEVWKKTTSMEV